MRMPSDIVSGEEEEMDALDSKTLSALDELPLAKWHLFVVLALGLVWIFDGYEVTLISIYRNQIENAYSTPLFKALVSAYQLGGVVGSVLFGLVAFVHGRRKVFLITLALYFFGVLFSGIETHPYIFVLSRFVTGLSVGGEFTAIFTGVDEFMPPSYRGRVNIGIDGTWHLGGTLASLLTLLVDPEHWRPMFLLGWAGILALVVMRRNVPQSPRWLLLKGCSQSAAAVVEAIVATVGEDRVLLKEISVVREPGRARGKTGGEYCLQIVGLLREGVFRHPRKFVVSFSLIFTQAFFFNLVYYQYPAILSDTFGLEQDQISIYMLPLSLVSFVSTVVLGPFFDTIGRRPLLLLTYTASGALLLISYAVMDLAWREVLVCLLFLFGSPASSAANLVASEIFPTASRTIMLFVMFMVSMGGGAVGVWCDSHVLAGILMISVGVLAFFLCPNSENKSLEQIQKM